MNLKFQTYTVIKRNPTDGREIELTTNLTHVVWRYVGDATWIELIDLLLLKGQSGDDGNDGREVELSTSNGFVVWRYVGDFDWIDICPIPVDGREVELSANSTHIIWRYVGDLNWVDLVELSTLKGDAGDPGDNGREVEMRENAGWVQWRYVGDVSWIQLYEIPSAPADTAVQVAIDFVDAAALTFVYNCPVALKFTSQESEGDDATISPALDTEMAQYGKVTITAAEVGLIVLNGNTL